MAFNVTRRGRTGKVGLWSLAFGLWSWILTAKAQTRSRSQLPIETVPSRERHPRVGTRK
jgi:hypothetical protein